MRRADPDRLVSDVARRMAELRAQAGWTQQDFALALGMSLRHVQRLERGANVTLHSIAKIAATLGVDVVALFTPPKSRTAKTGRPRTRLKGD